MRITLDIPWDPEAAVDLLNGCVRAAVRALRARPLPLQALSGVVYDLEPIGAEVWLDPHRCYELGAGDCEDLAIWRAAELLVHGRSALLPGDPGHGGAGVDDANVFLRDMGGGGMWHAMTAYQVDGARYVADPSADLGMRALPDLTLQRWRAAGVSPRVCGVSMRCGG